MADPLLRAKLHNSNDLVALRDSHIQTAHTVFPEAGRAFTEVTMANGRTFDIDVPMRLLVAGSVSPAATANTDVIDIPVPGRVHLGTPDPGFQGPTFIMGTNTNGAVIAGGVGNDVVFAGQGANQVLSGGAGADVFEFLGPNHTATITDFDVGQDRIAIQAQPKSAVTVTESAAGDAVVNYKTNHITLAGVTKAELDADLRPSLLTNSGPAVAQLLETPIGSVQTPLPLPSFTILPPSTLFG